MCCTGQIRSSVTRRREDRGTDTLRNCGRLPKLTILTFRRSSHVQREFVLSARRTCRERDACFMCQRSKIEAVK